MNNLTSPTVADRDVEIVWPYWRRLLFRFLFVYCLLIIAPWEWLSAIPGTGFLTDSWSFVTEWIVGQANRHVWHVRDELVPLNGSGDTSFGWAQFWTYLALAFIGCLIWSVFDRRRRNYTFPNYVLCLLVRYHIALVALGYGIQKIFLLQMTYPSVSLMATPLGDLLPMRFSWLFIGYSTPYQFFSGAVEVLAALLLLWRRTATLGALLATGIFMNVLMLNLSYDIPVKIFSLQMVFLCLFLVLSEGKRLLDFFVLGRQTSKSTLYEYKPSKRWARTARVAVKFLFVVQAIGITGWEAWGYYKQVHGISRNEPVKPGLYNVVAFARNGDTVTYTPQDNLRWTDFVFDGDGTGSLKCADSAFAQYYGRGYFKYEFEESKPILHLKPFRRADTGTTASFSYALRDTSTIDLTGRQGEDALFVRLRKSNHRFQLAENQFHWLSEANR